MADLLQQSDFEAPQPIFWNKATMVPSISPTVRPGFVQDALAAIQAPDQELFSAGCVGHVVANHDPQERLTFEPKSQPNVQLGKD